jgi:hypothetical protein
MFQHLRTAALGGAFCLIGCATPGPPWVFVADRNAPAIQYGDGRHDVVFQLACRSSQLWLSTSYIFSPGDEALLEGGTLLVSLKRVEGKDYAFEGWTPLTEDLIRRMEEAKTLRVLGPEDNFVYSRAPKSKVRAAFAAACRIQLP